MREAFSGRALSASTKTQTAAIQPVTPKAAWLSSMTSLLEIFKAFPFEGRAGFYVGPMSPGRAIELNAVPVGAPGLSASFLPQVQ